MSKCDNCGKSITKTSPRFECNNCGKIVHANQLCTGLSSKQLSALHNAENLEWICEDCRKESPHRKSFIVPENDGDDDGRDGKEGVIQVVLQQEEQVDQWICAARTETIALEDITPNAPNPEVAKRTVLLRRALIKANKTLLWKSKQTLKETYKYIWFQGGKVLARKFDNDKPVMIRSSCDIDKLSTQKYR
ncbi:unnamed protein product [Parnassius apollo]|uniref:(apollo) hypothetical protein n=1 Tax=Parnassius apollo TaxID=110799 RepID=A0A8S3VYP2_PARAO|nr:unnamed protein product [Parnassius apollo]